MSAMPMTPGLRVLSKLLETHTGQQLAQGRHWRIDTALRPIVRELGLSGLEALAAKASAADGSILATRVVEALLNNETSFYRDVAAFALLERDGFDRLRAARRRERRLRIWCAACSTGQEPYSIAMTMREDRARWAGWDVEIVATDISGSAIAKARHGRYSQFEVQRGLPVRSMLRFFARHEDDWIVTPELRDTVKFGVHNLLDPAPGSFDVILCRNVLMYFPAAIRTSVFERLGDALAPDGILMLGAGETVIGQTRRFVADPDLRGLYAPASGLAGGGARVHGAGD